MGTLTKKRYELIHKALHNNKCRAVVLGARHFPIQVAENGQRYVTWNKSTFITQDPKKSYAYGRMIQNGARITRIMRAGSRWGIIINNEIIDPN